MISLLFSGWIRINRFPRIFSILVSSDEIKFKSFPNYFPNKHIIYPISNTSQTTSRSTSLPLPPNKKPYLSPKISQKRNTHPTNYTSSNPSILRSTSTPSSPSHDEIPRILFVPRRNRSRKIETCSDGRVLGLHIPRNEDFIGKFPPREPGRVLVILPASILVLSFTAHPPPNSPSSSPAHLPTFWTTCSRCDPASGGWESRRQRAGQG